MFVVHIGSTETGSRNTLDAFKGEYSSFPMTFLQYQKSVEYKLDNTE